MKFGAHISIAGGIQNAPLNANKINCEVFQMFSRSPRGGKPTYTKESIKEFLDNTKKLNFKEWYIHTPYYINLASKNKRIYNGSIEILKQELIIANQVKAKYIMTHLGSSKDFSNKKQALDLVIKGLKEILKNYKGKTQFLIENSAGSGQIIGDTFEEISYILNKLKKYNIGICFDTAHAFASGYDLRTKDKTNKVLEKFDKLIGLKNLKMFHFNDSKVELNSKKDRHEHIGFGKIGKTGFKTLINHPKLKNVNTIIETPIDEIGGQEFDLDILKKLRK